uniref:VWFA domain-containing protein n=1 Tax=Heterorhabditis bacteriophora TaxID=37862 RepID=A0A1I7X5I9_HETBA
MFCSFLADPTSNCLTLKPPHGAPTTTTISSTSTMISTSTTKRLPDGVFCDVSDNHLLNVFLIDVAVPTIGTLEDKLSKIRSYLSSADFTVNLSKTGNWGKVAFHLATYSGEITGLQYVENNLVKQPVGEGRNLIIITDGIDITDKESYNTALRLRNNFKYTISAVVVSTSQIVRNTGKFIQQSLSFVYAISEKLNQQNKNSQFAIITYNSAIVFNSMVY